MAALFYVWDAAQHNSNTTITTLEQAEYFATHPQDLGFTENLKNWLLDVERIVTSPELAENFDEEIIEFFSNVEGFFNFSTDVFVIEYLQEKSKYLYKILVETLRRHNLVAFDSKHYIFFSKDVIFPDQKSIEKMLDAVQAVTKEQLLQFKVVPSTSEKLSIFADQWLELNQVSLSFIKQRKKNQFNETGYYRDFNDELYEDIIFLSSGKRGVIAYDLICVTSYIQILPEKAIRIFRPHPINQYTLQYLLSLHGIEGEASHFEKPEQLQLVLQQVYDFLIYDAEKHKDIESLNQWVNHGDEKEYITGLAVIQRLILAKYVNDPLYEQLVAEALPYAIRGRGPLKNATLEQFHERLEKEIKNIFRG
ncbi:MULTISPECIES: hypothetical protein [Acinetobacter]|uniref:Uncharacterized protein n=1 Tax=Acinetobacter cumulans TaxID=2136182 RepID=A0ABX9U7T4_9GAMM|nr:MULTISPECIES: hypothetical protein [Acinetobacter]RLL47334.1 hypothetical protein D9K79_06835 [Acinetobacter cumulans]UUS61622.1 hypothetical protein MST17_04705 [Acinetobacter sp. YH16056_T]